MLTPSYSELMETIQEGEKLDSRVTSRYTVVLAAAKRARQITDGANPLTYAPTDCAVSIACCRFA
jgi:DNA-directed RNA polymerase subunit omega